MVLTARVNCPVRRERLVGGCLLVAVLFAAAPVHAGTKGSLSEIAYSAHGALFDSRGREIRMSRALAERFYESFLEDLTTAAPTGGDQLTLPPLDPFWVKDVLSGMDFTKDELLLTKSALIQFGIDAATPDARLAYQGRFDLLRQATLEFLDPQFRSYRSVFESYVTIQQLRERLRQLWEAQRINAGYNSDCVANGVPVPPDWPTGGWVNQGVLPFDFNFLGSGFDTEVWTYTAPLGVCYALPRKTGPVISLLGVICQGETSGKACFWDNRDFLGAKLELVDGDVMKIAEVQNGATLVENCTSCHRGGNAFIIHPGTPLDAPIDRDPVNRYQPMGQAASSNGAWENPPAGAPQGSGPCSSCHEIGAPTDPYCNAVLRNAAQRTMPRSAAPAGWFGPAAPWRGHITWLRTLCLRSAR